MSAVHSYYENMSDGPFSAIDHVQLAMPAGEEAAARRFFGEILGMRELPKPEGLVARGGYWFASGPVQLHLGVEKDFRPARKAHPALRCRDYVALLVRLKQYGVQVVEASEIPGVERCHVHDPFGNRIELISA
jgi:catechol 2,3-dioxygenase-like lactoylglutathione lyase family enzyme